MTDPQAFLRRLFDTAVAAVQPETCLPPFLPQRPKGRVIVIGAGKASAAMAQTLERHMPGPLEGVVVTRYGHGVPCKHIEIVEAAHPVPDAAGREAAQRILDAVQGLSPDDLVICLLSGGGSALLSLPALGLTVDDKQAVTKALLASGAPIEDINCVRKHLSAIKGGRLAEAAHPARVLTLAISDVVGDDPSVIASGPTVADPTTRADARAILEKWDIDAPAAVLTHLDSPHAETPKPGARTLANSTCHIVAKPADALTAAQAFAEAKGVKVHNLGDAVEGEARSVARAHSEIARTAEGSLLILSGGELTVVLAPNRPANARGGPNAEYALALALALDGAENIHALACDSDGSDGVGDFAGARVTPDTLERAAANGLDCQSAMEGNDTYGLFEALGDALVTGPTHTNVNDIRAILVT